MSAPDLTATLLACQNSDPSVRQAAEMALKSAEEHNLSDFLIALATELGTEGKNESARQLAGLHFKNLLVAKDDALQVEKHDRWKAVPSGIRSVIKSTVLGTIRSPVTVARHTAAQACSEIATIELPYKEWPEFLTVMMNNVTSRGGGRTTASRYRASSAWDSRASASRTPWAIRPAMAMPSRRYPRRSPT